MARKAPTIRDVALRAGVSVATASNVVNGNRPVGEESRRKVLEAVAALGYRLNRAASSLRGASSRLIGMVVPDIANVFFGELVRDVEELAEKDGYDLLLVTTSEDPAIERRRIEALVSRRIDGLLVGAGARRYRRLAAQRARRRLHAADRAHRPRRPVARPRHGRRRLRRRRLRGDPPPDRPRPSRHRRARPHHPAQATSPRASTAIAALWRMPACTAASGSASAAIRSTRCAARSSSNCIAPIRRPRSSR